jgi:AraC-like DNA-binding protein
MAYCAENYNLPLTLDSVANELHISKYHISHLFSYRIKVSFCDFLGRLRVNDVCKRLRLGEDVTTAALAAGFNSIRSFNRMFMKIVGVTPTQYLRSINSK